MALIAAALLATASLFLLALACAHGEAGYLASLGRLVFREQLAAATLAGAAIIVVACYFAVRRRGKALPALEAAA